MSATDGEMGFYLLHFLFSGISVSVSKTVTAPIERVKLVIQTQDANPMIRSGQVPRYTGIENCFTRIKSEQGMLAFWRGNGVNILRHFPTQAFNLTFKDTIKWMCPKYNKDTEFLNFFGTQLAAGGLAGAASLTIVYPLDYARTRLASDVGTGNKHFNGLMDCMVKTIKGPGGFFSLYKGFSPSVAGIIAYRGSQFGLYDTISTFNPYAKEVTYYGSTPSNSFFKFVTAQVSVTVSRLCAYPFDTIRRRLQMESDKPPVERMYKGTFHAAKKILRDEGMGGMFKGALANTFRGAGASARDLRRDRRSLPHRPAFVVEPVTPRECFRHLNEAA